MGTTPAPPGEAVALLTGQTGEPTAIQVLSDRRGSRAWKLQGPKRAVALKANNPDGDNARDKAAEMAQEDDHLRRLTAADALSPDYRVSAGTWDGGRWLAVNWIDGAPLWRALALARGPEGDRASVRPWLAGIARTWTEHLALMYAAGWAHADVQPTNTLVTHDGHAAVIDYALGCGPGDGRRVPYRGALTHTTAPELATQVLDTPPTPTSRHNPPATSGAWAPPCSGAGPDSAPSPTTTTSTGRRSWPPSPRAPPPRCATSGRGPSPRSRTPSPRAWHPTPQPGPPRRS
ncbi:hypothetical protein ABT282_38610 [Streptomyces sp. NPDC000927]|uniref:hypothetical protein n=1 Tax=Streptomyces sp. NPDC000927 TaxID=3154371 RepID=UPI00332261D2